MVFFCLLPYFCCVEINARAMVKKETEKVKKEADDEQRHAEAMEFTQELLERMVKDEHLVQALEQRIEKVLDKKMQEFMQQVQDKKGE